MKTQAITYAVLLTVTSVGAALAETAEDCQNNTDAQKFVDGTCNTLKGYDVAPRSEREIGPTTKPLGDVPTIDPAFLKLLKERAKERKNSAKDKEPSKNSSETQSSKSQKVDSTENASTQKNESEKPKNNK